MQSIIKSFLLVILLVSCGGNDSRYRDTQMLEHPPAITISKPGAELRVIDNSKIPKKRHEAGLGEDVYMTTSTPPQMRIKQSLDDAWSTLGLALKQSDIEITDREHDKGLYYVLYDPEKSFFSGKHNEAIYVLTVESDGAETLVSATLGNAAEQSSAGGRGKKRGADKDNSSAELADGAEKLLQSLYESIRNDLKEE
ncbi:outer membrane protein assembly factor BamC [Methylobacter sp. S3L5C]|uniref:outer membrane protein assembly factor BamC n=1 Tax=Methylobacter sp. S3L5C TaxID=2839024 RepID=UPI001FABB67A|nr:outer membrane protein assembly factor BamC [Methylobacter sp. S3L5C]UOA09238.1 outer membrane protein assembly factor BamC [Methylobacter sp. S3L5C]